MSESKKGRKLLRLLLAVSFAALVLSGCGGTARYQTLDLNAVKAGETNGEKAEETVISMGETAAALADGADGAGALADGAGASADGAGASMNGAGVPADGAGASGDGAGAPANGADGLADGAGSPGENGEAETEKYASVDETVVVTADVLNVRETDNQSARIYVQLKNGDTLHRTGYSEEWSQVIYDGKTAYVASDMVEAVKGEETTGDEVGQSENSDGAEDQAGEGTGTGSEFLEVSGDAVSARIAKARGEETEIPWNGHTVAIDAGHQAKANAEKEPIGPSSETMKAKMPEGSVGIASGVPEYELTLTVAKKLETELKARGYHVVMIRTGHDVNLSNAERSIAANKSGADIFIRLHANSMENSGVYGALSMCMTAQNPYNAGLHDKSYSLSKKIVDNICAQTGTKNRGVQEADNSGEINWCEIPVSVVEMGFLSNPDEDRWLQDDSYQNKLVSGIAVAVDSYFAEGN